MPKNTATTSGQVRVYTSDKAVADICGRQKPAGGRLSAEQLRYSQTTMTRMEALLEEARRLARPSVLRQRNGALVGHRSET